MSAVYQQCMSPMVGASTMEHTTMGRSGSAIQIVRHVQTAVFLRASVAMREGETTT